MTTRTVHILTEEGDIVPSTGDSIAMLHGEPALFHPNRAARLLTDDQAAALRLVHALLSGNDTDEGLTDE